MKQIPFKGTIREVGNSYMVTIPREFIGDKLHKNSTYWFTVETEEQEGAK